MARRFKVTVDGEQFEVEVEEIGISSGWGAAPLPRVSQVALPPAVGGAVVTPAPQPAAAPEARAKPDRDSQVAVEGAVTAPLPGTVTAIRVSVGQLVEAGDTVCVLEAMKMENEIPAGRRGIVKQILVSKGDAVAVNQPLILIE